MSATQATMWVAQTSSGTAYTGGYGGEKDVSASDLPLRDVVIFEIVHQTFSHGYYAPQNVWYRDGDIWTDFSYPAVYTLKDGSVLTVDWDVESACLTLSQTRKGEMS